MRKIYIYTDGACFGNPGPGGWACIIKYTNGDEKEIFGAEEYTTNNRMELLAAIKALSSIKKKEDINIFTDSKYVKDGITSWINKWKHNGWKTSNKKTVKNLKLWQKLDNEIRKHQVTWNWVKGHSDNKMNERVDVLAKLAAKVK